MLGKMQVKTIADSAHGEHWREGVVMIRHPNFTGMQMDVVSRGYTPARYVNLVEVTRAGSVVLRMEGGISISEDPNIRFNYDGAGAMRWKCAPPTAREQVSPANRLQVPEWRCLAHRRDWLTCGHPSAVSRAAATSSTVLAFA